MNAATFTLLGEARDLMHELLLGVEFPGVHYTNKRQTKGRRGDGGEHPAIPSGVPLEQCVVNDYLGTSVAFDLTL